MLYPIAFCLCDIELDRFSIVQTHYVRLTPSSNKWLRFNLLFHFQEVCVARWWESGNFDSSIVIELIAKFEKKNSILLCRKECEKFREFTKLILTIKGRVEKCNVKTRLNYYRCTSFSPGSRYWKIYLVRVKIYFRLLFNKFIIQLLGYIFYLSSLLFARSNSRHFIFQPFLYIKEIHLEEQSEENLSKTEREVSRRVGHSLVERRYPQFVDSAWK